MPQTTPWNGPSDAPIFEIASSDDKTWLAPATFDQVTSLIMDPNRWIQELNDLNPTNHFITLREDFLLRLNVQNMPETIPDHGKEFVVQGIIGTNVLTVRPQIPLSPHTGAWDGYWQHWYAHSPLDVTYSRDFGLGYAHLELTEKGDDAFTRADKIAAFLMLGANPKKFIPHPDTGQSVLYLNLILCKKASSVSSVSGHTVTPELPRVMFAEVTAEILRKTSVSLIANTNDLSSIACPPEGCTPPPPPPPPACNNTVGYLNEKGLIVLDDVVVKDYPEPVEDPEDPEKPEDREEPLAPVEPVSPVEPVEA